jgi:hypothetical protein
MVLSIQFISLTAEIGFCSLKMTLYDLEKSLLDTLNDNKDEILKNEYPDDLIKEYVDGEVPVYNSDLLKLALDEIWLAIDEPEYMGFDGKNTGVNAIAGNVYEHLLEKANEWLENNKK